MTDQFNIRALRSSVEVYLNKPADRRFTELSDLTITAAERLAPDDPIAQARLHVLRARRSLAMPESDCPNDPAYVNERREVERYTETFCDDVHLILVLDVLIRLEELNESR